MCTISELDSGIVQDLTMLKRDISDYLRYLAEKYPIVVLTGPRQSGKTTLVKQLFPEKPYVSLEDPDMRAFAQEDPRGFLATHPEGAILDEIQYVPPLFSYLQTLVDHRQKPGDFVLTGSQNFLLMEKITQSLAGRAGIAHLLPLTYGELRPAPQCPSDLWSLVFNGFYPRIYDAHLDPSDWYKNYVNTYVERDVRQIKNILDLGKFRLFIQLCAGRIGQLLNMESLSADCGIDQKTLKSWLGLLESSFILFRLYPHHENFNKRLVKQPKLYFYDTGVACYLLGLEKPAHLETHYAKGNLFENYVVVELIKQQYNRGKDHRLSFWRDNHGHEIDVLLDTPTGPIPLEIKSGRTISSDALKGIAYWQELNDSKESYLIYGGTQAQKRTGTHILGYQDLDQALEHTHGEKS